MNWQGCKGRLCVLFSGELMLSRKDFRDQTGALLRRCRKASQLSPMDIMLLLRAFPHVCYAACLVRFFPSRMLHATLRSLDQTVARPWPGQVSLGRLAAAVNRASRLVPGATCLMRAIAASKLMGKEGYPARIRFGVIGALPDGLGAHCWVEVEGIPVLSRGEGYERLRPSTRGIRTDK